MLRYTLLSLIFCFFLEVKGSTQFFVDSLLPIPENLHANVAFWIKIYTEVTLEQGLLHDSHYPFIEYQRLFIGKYTGIELEKHLRLPREKIAEAIRTIRTKDKADWGGWEYKIAAMFRKLPAEAFDSAEYRIRFQLGQKERFIDGMKRSGLYIDTIKQLLSKHGLPVQIAYLPHVESSFNKEAHSKAGAAGIWQIMPETAQKLLEVNGLIDERNDPILSTTAAAQILQHNFSILKSWPLAITAYNHGLTGMLRAVKQSGSRDLGVITSKYHGANFGFASRNFYSCFIAAVIVENEPLKYFHPFTRKKSRMVQDIKLNQALRVRQIYKILGISEEEFSELNPKFQLSMFSQNHIVNSGTLIRISANISQKQLISNVDAYQHAEGIIFNKSKFPVPGSISGLSF